MQCIIAVEEKTNRWMFEYVLTVLPILLALSTTSVLLIGGKEIKLKEKRIWGNECCTDGGMRKVGKVHLADADACRCYCYCSAIFIAGTIR